MAPYLAALRDCRGNHVRNPVVLGPWAPRHTPQGTLAVGSRNQRVGGGQHAHHSQEPSSPGPPAQRRSAHQNGAAVQGFLGLPVRHPTESTSPAVLYGLISAVDTRIDVVYRSSDGA
ncbi:hypothetical protein GGTG_12301 [Gaeumannomyces tritici R3-111a-1]|uniref:Uncharacterized protein n=1 Tax=Gaeumannomyces tritici (strain R3-111a-1) TaxID=644352 RepID=J3PFM6_GAET3|nr:hypothetical protein GGTG_12301 [Gaeumannomyces tritici R3-111a-1]EJT70128.1 hypothetical protein GGTG_12301 [Gaeumannomyces tritici R3-111a-1]